MSDIQDYFEYIVKNYKTFNDNPSVGIYFLELLTPETMELLGSFKSKITKDKNDKNVPHLEITEVVLAHCNVVNNKIQDSCIHSFLINRSVNY